jgi:hypothetical protein
MVRLIETSHGTVAQTGAITWVFGEYALPEGAAVAEVQDASDLQEFERVCVPTCLAADEKAAVETWIAERLSEDLGYGLRVPVMNLVQTIDYIAGLGQDVMRFGLTEDGIVTGYGGPAPDCVRQVQVRIGAVAAAVMKLVAIFEDMQKVYLTLLPNHLVLIPEKEEGRHRCAVFVEGVQE